MQCDREKATRVRNSRNEETKQLVKQYHEQYKVDNKEKFVGYENSEKRKIYKKNHNKKYVSENKCQIRTQQNQYRKERLLQDVDFKLRINLRGRLNHVVKGAKCGSFVRDLGCSVQELKSHIESKFTLEMSWDNWGPKTWHIDHIKPLSSFDLTDRDQFLEACHYTNLQPLYWEDNLSKGSKLLNINNSYHTREF
jgi:hypothetical protein